MSRNGLRAKRILDLVLSSGGIVLGWPLLGLVALAILAEDGCPIVFRQVRVGRKGRLFKILKFRTMTVRAEEEGRLVTVGADSRITRIGAWLRKFKLDELPQLFNVLSGDMSFVGPRPEVPKYVARYDERQRQVLEMRPGITDVASIEFRNESEYLARFQDPEDAYIREVMPRKIEMNLEYASKATPLSDLGVILWTLAKLP